MGSLYVTLLQALITTFFVTVIPSLILLLAHGSKCSFETQRSFHIRKDFSPNGGLSLPDVAVDPGSPFLPWP